MRPVHRLLRPAAAVIGVAAVASAGLASSGTVAHAGPLDDGGPLSTVRCGIGQDGSFYTGIGIRWNLPDAVGTALGDDDGFLCGARRQSGPKQRRIIVQPFNGGTNAFVLDGNFAAWLSIGAGTD